MHQAILTHLHPEHVEVELCRADELAQRRGLTSELDEMWSYVGKKAEPRWLWHAIDHLRSDHMLLYASDFPHWQFDGDEPVPAGIPPGLRRKILVDNPIAKYNGLEKASE